MNASPPRVHSRLVHALVALNLLLLVGLVGYSVWTGPRLPERYPVHWNARGEPNRWAERGSAEWYVMPIITGVATLLFVGLAYGIPRIPPRLMNLPHKEKFLALSPEQRVPVLRAVVVMLLAFSNLFTGLFLVIQVAAFEGARSGKLPLGVWLLPVSLGAVATVLVVGLVTIRRRILG